MTFTISWTGAKGGAAPSVHYATANVTVTSGADYAATSGIASLAENGCRCATVNAPILGDTTTEGTETFAVNVSNAVNAKIADAQGIGTIYDNEGPPSFVVTDVSGAEASGTLPFSVLLTNASGTTVSVDYMATSGKLVFAASETSKQIDVTVTGDLLVESNETFTLTLSSPFNADLGTSVATGTITNDDASPKLVVGDATKLEGNSGTTPLTFTVAMVPSVSDVTVDYATADGTATAGSDHTAASGTLTIPAGQASGTIAVSVSGDKTYEPNETLTLTLSNPVGASIVVGAPTRPASARSRSSSEPRAPAYQ
jgi:Calx-beta domain-containing protein